MSGYLDVKCPAGLSRGLSIFKVWKKQWCILRPHPIEKNTCVLALHSTVGVLANSTVVLPPNSTVCRCKSKSREYAFGVFLYGRYSKPYVLLAGQSESETQMWMAKIRAMLSGKSDLRKSIALKNSFDVSIIDNDFSRKCLLYGIHGTLAVSSHGILISHTDNPLNMFISWKHFADIRLMPPVNISDKNRICDLETNIGFDCGAGHLVFFCCAGAELVRAIHDGLDSSRDSSERISRSEGDLYYGTVHSCSTIDTGFLPAKENIVRKPALVRLAAMGPTLITFDLVFSVKNGHKWSYGKGASLDASSYLSGRARRSSWFNGPSDVSLDDTDLVMSKDANTVPSGQLLRCPRADHLVPTCSQLTLMEVSETNTGSSLPTRHSSISLASGIYEEIPEHIAQQDTKDSPPNKEADPEITDVTEASKENAYESVAECLLGTKKKAGKQFPPPPLPPRVASTFKIGDSWIDQSRDDTDEVDGDFCHHSVSSLPRCNTGPPRLYTKTLPKTNKARSFGSVFRKRVKSESRTSPKPDKPKKKRFDFGVTPSIEMISSVSRVFKKNLKISTPNTCKLGEARSCEYLEEDVVVEPRCSKSVEELPYADVEDFCASDSEDQTEGEDLSVMCDSDFSLPHDILELILRGREDMARLRLRRKEMEDDYIIMTPAGSTPCATLRPASEGHYTIMTSPAPLPVSSADIVT